MPAKLLDVNVLLGLLWPPHNFHARAIHWFLSHQHEGWATCPLTEMGFLRILTNPGFTPAPPRVAEATELLSLAKKASKHHIFWADGIPAETAISRIGSRVQGHKQLTDAYLLSLAMEHKAIFATFDRRVLQLAPQGATARAAIEVLH